MSTETVSVAALVDKLFRIYRQPNGQEYSYQEVSNALNGELDPSYVAKLRKGVIKNPGRDALKSLCLFFQVPATYFFPELDALHSKELPDERQMIRIALNSAGLSLEAQTHVEGLIEMLRSKKKES